MEENKHYCFNCRWYKAYYTKGFCHFDKQQSGKCTKQKKGVDYRFSCDQYQFLTGRSKSIEKSIRTSVIMRQLEDIIKDLTEAGQILKEEYFKEEKEDK